MTNEQRRIKLHNETKAAFELALARGTLTEERHTENYIGDYMYMGTRQDKLQFKHIVTREYITMHCPKAVARYREAAEAIGKHWQ